MSRWKLVLAILVFILGFLCGGTLMEFANLVILNRTPIRHYTTANPEQAIVLWAIAILEFTFGLVLTGLGVWSLRARRFTVGTSLMLSLGLSVLLFWAGQVFSDITGY